MKCQAFTDCFVRTAERTSRKLKQLSTLRCLLQLETLATSPFISNRNFFFWKCE